MSTSFLLASETEVDYQLWLDYIAQYRQECDEDRGMSKEKPLHDFTRLAADVNRYAAVIEAQMTNEEDQPLPEQEEANSDIHD